MCVDTVVCVLVARLCVDVLTGVLPVRLCVWAGPKSVVCAVHACMHWTVCVLVERCLPVCKTDTQPLPFKGGVCHNAAYCLGRTCTNVPCCCGLSTFTLRGCLCTEAAGALDSTRVRAVLLSKLFCEYCSFCVDTVGCVPRSWACCLRACLVSCVMMSHHCHCLW